MILTAIALCSAFFLYKFPAASYLLGFLISLLFPNADKSWLETVAVIAVVSSVPFFLISCDWKKIQFLNRDTLCASLFQVFSVLIPALLCSFILTDGDVLGGMAVALYTGGTMNSNAVAKLFKLDNERILFANLSDMAFGGLFYLFLLFAAKPLISKFLGTREDDISDFETKPKLSGIGQYLCGVFNFCIASMVNIKGLKNVPIDIFLYFAAVTVCAFLLNVVFCKIFKIDGNIMLITFTACIYGPAFIPGLTRSIKAPELLSSGLIIGSVGYAIGTFLGVFFTCLVRLI